MIWQTQSSIQRWLHWKVSSNEDYSSFDYYRDWVSTESERALHYYIGSSVISLLLTRAICLNVSLNELGSVSVFFSCPNCSYSMPIIFDPSIYRSYPPISHLVKSLCACRENGNHAIVPLAYEFDIVNLTNVCSRTLISTLCNPDSAICMFDSKYNCLDFCSAHPLVKETTLV